MKCKECGTKLPAGSTICYRCGKKCAGEKVIKAEARLDREALMDRAMESMTELVVEL